MFAKRQHQPAPPTAHSCSFFSVLAPHSQHSNLQPATCNLRSNALRLSLLSSGAYRLTYTTASTQPFWNQYFSHLFTRDGGVYPTLPISELMPPPRQQESPLSFHAFTGTHFATPFFSDSCRNGGVHPPLWSLPMNSTWEARASLLHSVTRRIFRASQVQSGCWPPLCFSKVTDGRATKQDHSVSRVPVPFSRARNFKYLHPLAKSVECPLPFWAFVE